MDVFVLARTTYHNSGKNLIWVKHLRSAYPTRACSAAGSSISRGLLSSHLRYFFQLITKARSASDRVGRGGIGMATRGSVWSFRSRRTVRAVM